MHLSNNFYIFFKTFRVNEKNMKPEVSEVGNKVINKEKKLSTSKFDLSLYKRLLIEDITSTGKNIVTFFVTNSIPTLNLFLTKLVYHAIIYP